MNLSNKMPDELVKLNQREWVNKINDTKAILESEKPKIASIILYDFFSFQVLPRKRNPDLPISDLQSQWKVDEEDMKPERLFTILTLLGYPESIAKRRCSCKRMKKVSSDLLYNGMGAQRLAGVRSCLISVCEQAVFDVVALDNANVIVDGKVNFNWPPEKCNGVVGYKTKQQVTNLIKWVAGGSMQDFLISLDSDLKADKFLKAMCLDNYQEKAVESTKVLEKIVDFE
ncbi:MAG: hypothetical protein WCS56_00250 [Bacilli bacterium]